MPSIWYEEVRSSDHITQGDLVPACLLPLPTARFYEDLLAETEESSEPIDIQQADIAVLSQACDIENDKIDSVVVCPTWDIEFFAQFNSAYRSTKKIEDLRQGREPAYHVLDRFEGTDISMNYRVVDFHHIYSVPKDYLQQLASRLPVRLRLVPPYREHLSQAFARYFMRVGLPSDVDKQALRIAVKNGR